MTEWSPRFWACIALVVVVVGAAHWPVLHAQALSLDDNEYLTHNALVTHPSWASMERFFTEVLKPSAVKHYYFPLSTTSLMVDYALGGRPEDLRVFHRTNLALHVLNAVLVFLLFHRLLGSLLPAVIAGLLFGVHPMTVESVAWIGERKTLLATFFSLLALLAYVAYVRGERPAWRIAAVGAYLLALFAKPTVVPLPLLLLVLDAWPLKRLGRGAVVEKWPFFLLSAAFGIITVISQQRATGNVTQVESDLVSWAARAGYLLAFYLGKIAWPMEVSGAYSLPRPFSPVHPAVLGGIAVVLALTAAVVVAARRTRAPLVGWLFFVIAIAPTFGFVHFSWIDASDKYVYFPALGVLLVIAATLAAAGRSPGFGATAKGVSALLLAAIIGLEIFGVRVTLRSWSDSMTLFRHLEKISPDAGPIHSELGVLLARESRYDEAIVHLRRAIELVPNYAAAQYNLGAVLLGEGHADEAVAHLRAADQAAPDDPETLLYLGIALRMLGRSGEAEARLRRAVELAPDQVEALNELGGLLVHEGRPGEAADPLRKALALFPRDAMLHQRLAAALLLRGGDPSEAIAQLREAIRIQPAWPEPYNALAWLRATSPDPAVRDTSEGLRLGARALELTQRRDPKVLDTFAATEASAGRFADALRTEREAIALIAGSPADSLARGMIERARLYQRREPYREPAPTR